MKKIVIALILAFFPVVSQAEFDFDAYQLARLNDIKTIHADKLFKASQNNGYAVTTSTSKYRMLITFSKELRKINPNNKKIISAWQKSLRIPVEFVERYQQEFKVVLDKETYWIPVQETLLPYMGSELHSGDKFELYIILIGAINNKLVFLTTEFKSDRAPL